MIVNDFTAQTSRQLCIWRVSQIGGLPSRVVRGLLTSYRGIVVLNERVRHYPEPVCGLLTTYAGFTPLLAFRLIRIQLLPEKVVMRPQTGQVVVLFSVHA
jgi:hypothetical protein